MTLEQKLMDVRDETITNVVDMLEKLKQGKTKDELLAEGFEERTINKVIEAIERMKKD